ncbi:GMC family oxidoreductase [Salinibacterium sp. ZJ450]|uniref:GMC family oxidoreductase n=1 Tax=Salinibacterium sp. ZJ450 TaxID=2708338 RepID=UPI001CD77823|nr:GMC family oxidoreductase [Salinibacterium sp. ZJ450]
MSGEVADVLIVGAGASGAIVARTMAQAGFSVVCLEQGRWIGAEEYASDKLERELLSGTTWNYNPNHRQRPEDYPVEVSDTPIHPVMFNAVGGSTVHYAAEWTRLLPSDFRLRTLDGVADDWPISYWDLAPYYDKVEDLNGVSAHPGDPAYPSMTPAPNPALPIGEMGRRAAMAFNELGWHWWPGYNAIASRPYRHQGACKRRATCMTGCPEGAKSSVDITIWPDALAAGAELITGARVRRVTTDASGLATGAEWIDRDGTVHHQRAHVVVLAANGVGTSRLMLLSDSAAHPNGLANSSDLVGRRLQMHPLTVVYGEYDEDLQTTLGPYGEPVTSSQFAERDVSRGFWGGARLTVMPIDGPVETWGRSDDRPLSQRYGAHFHNIANATGKAFEIAASMDDLPNVDNRVTIDPFLTDNDGIPAPKVTWQPAPDTEKALDYFASRAEDLHRAAGARKIRRVEAGADVGWHLLGTARMGTDATSSVVDPFGRAHDVKNLFVVDGSVFVTSGQTNPTATIMAFAQRAAEHMVATARNQRVAA